ncbi:MAG: helix-turn-helix domain-containing protein [Nanoarchaeota archaeon]
MPLDSTLQDIGLNRRESACYIALLELGPSKVGRICKKADIPSSKIYEILDGLMRRGLASFVVKNNVRHYQASGPRALLDCLDEKREEIEGILPQLMLKQKMAKSQSVGMYEGHKAVFTLFTALIADARPSELYLVFSIEEENKDDRAELFFKNLAVRRKDKGLDVRLLKDIRFRKKEPHTKLKLRYTRFNLPQGITVFRDQVIILSWADSPVAIKIESAQFAGQMREFFLQLWDSARQ